MITENDPIIINRQFLVVNSTYKLDVESLYTDEYAIRINYQVTPPVPYLDSDPEGSLLFTWWGYAIDNNGAEYNSQGGACGLSRDGKSTNGVLSFTPLFLKDILFLDVAMLPERINEKDKCMFRVTLKSIPKTNLT